MRTEIKPREIFEVPDWVTTLNEQHLKQTKYEAFDGLELVVAKLLTVFSVDHAALTAIVAQLNDAWRAGAMLSPSFNPKVYRNKKKNKTGRKWIQIGKRYRVLWWDYRKVRGVFEALEDHGYIKRINGYVDLRPPKPKRVPARVWPLDKMIELFEKNTITYKTHTPALVQLVDVVDDVKQLVDYEDDDFTNSRRGFLQRYNNHLCAWKISHEERGLNTEVYCIFSRGRFDTHGRFYNSGGWMIFNEDERAKIIFEKDGKTYSACETDYASMHPNLAASITGVELPNIDGDLYKPVCRYLQIPDTLRKAPKGMMFDMINASSVTIAIKAFRFKLNCAKATTTKKGKPKAMTEKRSKLIAMGEALEAHEVTLDALADAVATVHHKIGNWFGSDAGIYLMWHDAEIMRGILERCMELSIPALPMHDSVVYPEKHRLIVELIMEEELARYVEGIKSGKIELQPELQALASGVLTC